MNSHKLSGQLLAQLPDNLGGNTATSYLTKHYKGKCEVRSIAGNVIAVLPSAEDAFNVARAAIRLDHDVGSVVVHPTDRNIAHRSFRQWPE